MGCAVISGYSRVLFNCDPIWICKVGTCTDLVVVEILVAEVEVAEVLAEEEMEVDEDEEVEIANLR